VFIPSTVALQATQPMESKMPIKVKTIKLAYPVLHETMADPHCYRVVQVTDSTRFEPNQRLQKQEVDELCRQRDWKVTIVSS
jgi:hypothetical protein